MASGEIRENRACNESGKDPKAARWWMRGIEAQVLSARTVVQEGLRLPAEEVLRRLAAPAGSAMPLPRVLVVLAHPDDEVLALGARLERMKASRLLTVTDGAPADGADAHAHGFGSVQAYRDARRQELLAALADAGLAPEAAPECSWQVPDQTACLHLVHLSRAVATEIEAFGPEAVMTHPYEGGHPDHDACAFVVSAAVELAKRKRPGWPGAYVAEAPFYHAGEGGAMRTGSFLGEPATDLQIVCELTAMERKRKRMRLGCFASQAETLEQFGVERESFRVAPRYDFSQRPHAGTLLYERFPWGMRSDRFCSLAREAWTELFGADARGAFPSGESSVV